MSSTKSLIIKLLMKSSSENIRAFKYIICNKGYDFLKESVFLS